MTIRKTLEQYLFDHCLFRDQAKDIIDRMAVSPAQEAMKDRWNDDASGYPPEMLAVLKMAAKTEAVQWIDEKIPMHFARTMLSQ